MKKKLSLSLSLLTIMWNVYAVDYTVTGEIEGIDGTILYMHDYDKQMNIDSAQVSNGRVCFQGSYERPAFVRIENGQIFSNCVLDTLAVVDFNTHFPSSGSALNKKLMEFTAENKKITDELNKFGAELSGHGFEQPELGEIFSRLYDKLLPDRIRLCTNAIAENPNGVGESAVMQLGSLRGLTPDDWDAVYAVMPPYLKERDKVEYFNNMFTNLRNSQPGKPFTDFSAKTIDGKDVKLSDYIGQGKYVLLDFWASWCGPCREEAENTLRPLYNKYRDDDRFSILSIATWEAPEETITALDKLGYPWPQLIDAGQTPMRLYGFDAIPTLFLIDPDGIILERELRGENLINAVDNILDKRD